MKKLAVLCSFVVLFSSCAMHAPDASAFMEVFDKEHPKDWRGFGVGYVSARGGDYTDKMWAIPSYWDIGGNLVFLDYCVAGFSFQWLPIIDLGFGNRFVAFRSWVDFLSLLGDMDQFNYGAGLVQQVLPTESLRFGLEENITHNSYAPFSGTKEGRQDYWALDFGFFSRYRRSATDVINSLSLAVRVQRRFFNASDISKYGRYLFTASLTVTWANKR